MKAVCKNRNFTKTLTLGKEYEIVQDCHAYYLIVNDNDEVVGVNKNSFHLPSGTLNNENKVGSLAQRITMKFSTQNKENT